MNNALSDADRLRASSSYSDAIAEYDAVSARSGIAYLFAHSRITTAGIDAQRTTLAWAQALAAAGHVDEALEMTTRATAPELLDDAHRAAAQIALDDARAQDANGRPDLALARLDRVRAPSAPGDLAAQADGLRPGYALAAAGYLLAAGQARFAVDDLEIVLAAGSTGSLADQARGLLPEALLTAGKQAIAANDEAGATADLQRIVDTFAATSQAAEARKLLGAPQPVTGTLVHRDGSPAGFVRVRLGSNYRRSGSGFMTSPPYYYALTDAQGAFSFTGIPVGAHLTLEILQSGLWSVLEVDSNDPSAQHPLYEVSVQPLTPVDLAFVRLP